MPFPPFPFYGEDKERWIYVNTCAVALGPVPDGFRALILQELPKRMPVDWTITDVGDTVQDLLTAAASHPEWTALFVTSKLHGDPALANALAAIMRRHETLRVVFFGTDSPPVREAVGSLVGHGLTNVCFDTDDPPPTLSRLIELITTDLPRNAVFPYVPTAAVSIAEPLGLERADAAPAAGPTGPVRVIRDKVIAVIAGKGGAGKTSVVANLFALGAMTEAVGAVDCDLHKSALYMHFWDAAHHPPYANFQDLAQTVEANHTRELGTEHMAYTLTARDREDCRRWVEHSAAKPWHHGILVPGVRRDTPLTFDPLPGIAAQVVHWVRERATVTFVDTPAPWDTSWDSLVLSADRLLLVTTPEQEHVLEASDVLRRLEDQLGIDRSKVSLVVNRRANGWGVSTDTIAATLKLKPVAVITDAPKAWEAARAAQRPVSLGGGPNARVWVSLYSRLTGLTPGKQPRPKRSRGLLRKRAG